MLGMSKANGADIRPGRSGLRPRHWAQAQAENPLARFIPFSSLVSPHDVITRGGDYPPPASRCGMPGLSWRCQPSHRLRRHSRSSPSACRPSRR
jgi:type IV secretion system protein VirB4